MNEEEAIRAQERELCIKEACIFCARGVPLAKLDAEGWMHPYTAKSGHIYPNFVGCAASKIWIRMKGNNETQSA